MSEFDTNTLDDETLVELFLLAGIERRFDDQRALEKICILRGLVSPGTQSLMEATLRASESKLPPRLRLIKARK